MKAPIEVMPVMTARERAVFARLPDRLMAADPAYVAPLGRLSRRLVDPARSPYFEHAEAQPFLASSKGRAVGRISAQIDRHAVALHGPVGHFGLLAALDADVAAALLAAAGRWLKRRGMERALGPFGLSINQEAGLLVAGHDTPPMVMMGHDPPWLGPAVEAAGWSPVRDLLAYRVPVAEPPPAFVRGLIARAEAAGVEARPMRPDDFAAELAGALAIFNDAWAGNWGFVPFTGAEMADMAHCLKPLLDPGLVWFAELGGETVAMLVAVPNLNEALAGLGGRLLPFGWARLAWRLKVRGLSSARVPLMGVRRAAQRTALGAALPFLLAERARAALAERGYGEIEMSWVLDDNLAMRRVAEALGGRVAKTYRLYGKELA